MQDLIEKIDEQGKGAWIALMVISFILVWPLGLALLFFLIWSGRLGRHNHYAFAGGPSGHRHARSDCRPRNWGGCGGRSRRRRRQSHAGSGNSAFDAYREDVLRRLEEEQAEFQDYLDRLRQAKDKEEFEAFVAERKSKGAIVPQPGNAEPDTEEDGDENNSQEK